MPKRPPRSPRRAPSTASGLTSGVTSESSHVEILRAKVLVHTEIVRRQAFADLQALEARLAAMPPLTPPETPPVNES